MRLYKLLCPFCKNDQIKIIDSIDSNALIKLYCKMFKYDLSYLLNTDLNFCECLICKLRFYYPLITGDESFYNSLQCFDWYYIDEKPEFLEASKYVKPTDRVLEIGCGKGAFSKYLSTKQYVGLDFSAKAKEMASKEGITIENETVQNYAINNKSSFDVVVSFQVLEHVSDPFSFIQAKVDTLKVGGKLIIAVPSEDSFLKYVVNGILNMPPHHVTRWTDDTLKFLAKQYNLDLISLYHEKLQDIHKHWFLNVFFYNAFLKPKLLDTSLRFKFFSKISTILGKIFVRGLNKEVLPVGHTVVAVYKKK